MSDRKHIFNLLTGVISLITAASCSPSKGLVFAGKEWHISEHYGQIIDKDTTYRMTFGNVLIPDPLPIISSNDSVGKYPGMDKFLMDILHTVRLDSAEILFYAPHMQKMFVKTKGTIPPMKPSSISSPMSDEKPYTMWINKNDIEDWTRNSSEMYTYTYFNKRKRQLLVVDLFDYGDTPIAQITIFQSKNKMTEKMNVHDNLRRAFFEIHDLRNYMHDIEFWANNIEARRRHAFANYKIGQEQKLRGK